MIRATIAMLAAVITAPANAEPATCIFNIAAPEPCTISFATDAKGNSQVRAVGRSGKRVSFTGKRAGGWWSGNLNGKPATGYELNRGNITFTTHNLATTFQYFTTGNEHGTY